MVIKRSGQAWLILSTLVGAIMARLINRDSMPKGPLYAKGKQKIRVKEMHEVTYDSPDILDLVQECVRWSPDDRPTLRDLRRRIRAVTSEGGEKDLARGLRKHDGLADKPQHALVYLPDDYKLAMAAAKS